MEVRVNGKVSPSGLLPTNIVADSEEDVVKLFNKVNRSDDSFGYKIVRFTYKGYEIAKTFRGKLVPKWVEPRTFAYIIKLSNGTYSFAG